MVQTVKRGLGEKQIAQSQRTENKVLSLIRRNEPVCFNEIMRGIDITNRKSVNKAITRLLEKKKIRRIKDPKARKNTKCYESISIVEKLSPVFLERHPEFSPVKDLKVKKGTLSDQIQSALFVELIEKSIKNGKYSSVERIFAQKEREMKRKMRGNEKISLKKLQNVIIYSELTMTKNDACKKYGITVKTLNENIKRHPSLQKLQNMIQKLSDKVKQKNEILIPIQKGEYIEKLVIVKENEAKKKNLI